MNVFTDRPSCLMVTHSCLRGDLSSVAFAQSCAAKVDAAKATKRSNRVIPPFYQIEERAGSDMPVK